MVRCDGCKFWYHQSCMGIVNEDDLEDEWYCFSCTDTSIRRHGPSEPILVPTNNEPSVSKANTHLPLYQVDDSATIHSNSTPRARIQANGSRLSNIFHTPRAEPSISYRHLPYQSQSSSSNPSTPYRLSNRSDIKVWATPSLFEDVAATAAPDSPFDPTSTPSRGLKFGIPLISTATPKDLGAWSTRVGGLFATPFQQAARSNQNLDLGGKRTLDFSDFTPGIPSWNNSPLALASSSAKGQVLEFGGDLVIEQSQAGPSASGEIMSSAQTINYTGTLAPAAEIQMKDIGG